MRSTLVASFFAVSLALAGCAGSEPSSSSSTGSEQDVVSAPIANVTVEAATAKWGATVDYGGSREKVRGIHAFLFQGEAGDAVTAKANVDTAGTVYILSKTANGFTAIAKSKIAEGAYQGTASATLSAAGTYALAYEASVPAGPADDANDLFPESHAIALTLGGTPVSPALKLRLSVREAWEQVTVFADVEKEFKAVQPTTLPAAALAQFKEWNEAYGPTDKATASTWKVGGTNVFVVEVYHDGGMSIAFYDAQNNVIGTGDCLEDSDFSWKD